MNLKIEVRRKISKANTPNWSRICAMFVTDQGIYKLVMTLLSRI